MRIEFRRVDGSPGSARTASLTLGPFGLAVWAYCVVVGLIGIAIPDPRGAVAAQVAESATPNAPAHGRTAMQWFARIALILGSTGIAYFIAQAAFSLGGRRQVVGRTTFNILLTAGSLVATLLALTRLLALSSSGD